MKTDNTKRIKVGRLKMTIARQINRKAEPRKTEDIIKRKLLWKK